MKSARDIYQTNLDAVSRALMTCDMELYCQHIATPNMMAMEDTEIVMSSIEEMEIIVRDFRDQLLARGVREYRRICRDVKFVAGQWDMITGTHETWCLNKDGPVVEPYLCQMTLLKIDGNWKGCRIEHGIRNADWPVLSPDIAAAQNLRRATEPT